MKPQPIYTPPADDYQPTNRPLTEDQIARIELNDPQVRHAFSFIMQKDNRQGVTRYCYRTGSYRPTRLCPIVLHVQTEDGKIYVGKIPFKYAGFRNSFSIKADRDGNLDLSSRYGKFLRLYKKGE